jgi:hypothetical protein
MRMFAQTSRHLRLPGVLAKLGHAQHSAGATFQAFPWFQSFSPSCFCNQVQECRALGLSCCSSQQVSGDVFANIEQQGKSLGIKEASYLISSKHIRSSSGACLRSQSISQCFVRSAFESDFQFLGTQTSKLIYSTRQSWKILSTLRNHVPKPPVCTTH